MIYSLPEPDASLGLKKRKDQDQVICMDSFSNALEIEGVERIETVRLGRVNESVQLEDRKPRPLLAKLSDVIVKWEIVIMRRN